MVVLKTLISLAVGLAVGALIWVFFGELLREYISSAALVGAINGVATIFGGVIANVATEKLLGIGDKADV